MCSDGVCKGWWVCVGMVAQACVGMVEVCVGIVEVCRGW